MFYHSYTILRLETKVKQPITALLFQNLVCYVFIYIHIYVYMYPYI